MRTTMDHSKTRSGWEDFKDATLETTYSPAPTSEGHHYTAKITEVRGKLAWIGVGHTEEQARREAVRSYTYWKEEQGV